MKNIFFPKIGWPDVSGMLVVGILGALIASGFGILHDEITYTLCPEYFTKLKFHQFSYADFGFPIRILVAEVGILASWWVGFLAGWFLGRLAFPKYHRQKSFRRCALGFLPILVLATLGGVLGFFLGGRHWLDWTETGKDLGVLDLPAFQVVASIHLGTYAGAALGLLLSLIWIRK